MEFHPVAELFELMKGDAFDAFCEDVRANGLREPIFTAVDPKDGEVKIADGRNRYNACLKTGVKPRYREWDGKGELVSIVVSLNLHRRHLSESQRAMVAAKLANPQICGTVSQPSAAKLLNVSERSISSAAKVVRDGVPEIAEWVQEGKISVAAAEKLAELPKPRQRRIIKKGRNAAKKILGQIKERSLRAAAHGRAVCLLCKDGVEDTDLNFLAVVQLVSEKFPSHARYLNDISSELAETSLTDTTRSQRTRILEAIDDGITDVNECRRAVGLTVPEWDHVLAVLLDYDVEIYEQGGKTETARGARKKLLRRKARPSGNGDLTYEFDDESADDRHHDYLDL